MEIYFPIIQRKVLTPNDCASLDELIERIFAFGKRYSTLNKPFAWRFTRQDLERCLRDPCLQSNPSAHLPMSCLQVGRRLFPQTEPRPEQGSYG